MSLSLLLLLLCMGLTFWPFPCPLLLPGWLVGWLAGLGWFMVETDTRTRMDERMMIPHFLFSLPFFSSTPLAWHCALYTTTPGSSLFLGPSSRNGLVGLDGWVDGWMRERGRWFALLRLRLRLRLRLVFYLLSLAWLALMLLDIMMRYKMRRRYVTTLHYWGSAMFIVRCAATLLSWFWSCWSFTDCHSMGRLLCTRMGVIRANGASKGALHLRLHHAGSMISLFNLPAAHFYSRFVLPVSHQDHRLMESGPKRRWLNYHWGWPRCPGFEPVYVIPEGLQVRAGAKYKRFRGAGVALLDRSRRNPAGGFIAGHLPVQGPAGEPLQL